ncbi:alpha-amylase family glycosyl hydrolase [uncultured Paludibaculum sp.]|uniref:alpha-amylase family glycosyl hydrolase n=1 Tax=uncultured Paludibaculum sp. TaxID=1765020 RepID=UPI002AAC3765|nr:alpha-amylase family glycosyl hydrolase [uncultured Paludibaculum sp.]
MKRHPEVLVLTLTVCLTAAAQPPTLNKIEPPDWFTAEAAQRQLIVLSGTQLQGVRIECASPLQAGPAEINRSGTHVLFDLTIPAAAKPGRYPCSARNPAGTASIPFELSAPLPTAGRFQGFSNDDVIYLIMPDRFANGDPSNDDPRTSPGLFDRKHRRYYHGGDFAGIRKRLPYLKDLGVTAIWLTPIYENYNRLDPKESYAGEQLTSYHGYGATDLYAVEDHFGTLDDYRALVDEAHRLGLKVIQDHVENHVGPRHPWVETPPRAEWLHGTREQHIEETWQTWLLLDPQAGPLLRGVLDGWFAGILPDLNQDDPQVARYLIQNSTWWIARTGADAIRQDTVPYAPRAFWRDWSAALHQSFPHLKIVGEILDPDPALTSFYQGGRSGFDGIDTGLDSVFDFPLYFAIRDVFARHQSPLALARLLAHDSLYAQPQRLVTLLGLHDTKRFMSEDGATLDDLANAFTFLFTTRGIPMIYYGDEIGMAGGDDPENRHDFPGGWADDPHNAFEAAGRTSAENKLHDHIRKLTRLRAGSRALREGTTRPVYASESAYAFLREAGQERFLVIVHGGAAPETLSIPSEGPAAVSLHCEIGCREDVQATGKTWNVPIAPRTTEVYRVLAAAGSEH